MRALRKASFEMVQVLGDTFFLGRDFPVERGVGVRWSLGNDDPSNWSIKLTFERWLGFKVTKILKLVRRGGDFKVGIIQKKNRLKLEWYVKRYGNSSVSKALAV